MKKVEYLPFHAELILKSLPTNDRNIYWITSYNRDDKLIENCIKTYQHGRGYNVKAVLLDNPEKIVDAFKHKAKIDDYICNFYENYLINLAKLGTQEQIDFFVSNNNQLIGEYSLYKINALIPSLPDHIISSIFKNGSATMGSLNSGASSAAETIKLLKKHPEGEELLSSYLSRQHKYIKHERHFIEVRDKLIETFPDSLDKFTFLPLVKDYVDSQQNTEKEQFFIDTPIENTIYMRIDGNLLQKNYPVPKLKFEEYLSVLKDLMVSLEDTTVNTGVVKTHTLKSIDTSNGEYRYSHIYLNTNNQENAINKDAVHFLIDNLYGQYLPKYLATQDYSGKLDLSKWINSVLLNYSLEEKLDNKDNIKKRFKV